MAASCKLRTVGRFMPWTAALVWEVTWIFQTHHATGKCCWRVGWPQGLEAFIAYNQSMRFTGTLTNWNDERGFGFIEPIQGGQPIFVHIKSFPSGTGRPSNGQTLTFEVETKANGKKSAYKVQYPPRAKQILNSKTEQPAPWTLARLLAIPTFVAWYIFVSMRWGLVWQVVLAYITLSVLTLFLYAFDKSAAMSKQWRTPENTLHILSLIGGWPGALIAQQLLRHKTNKPSFIYAFWFTVAANVAGFTTWSAGLLPFARL
jgi:uncharacterized membrane protein YsdA (DUF1294 family)/cold shock CspA family protein